MDKLEEQARIADNYRKAFAEFLASLSEESDAITIANALHLKAHHKLLKHFATTNTIAIFPSRLAQLPSLRGKL